MVLIMSKVKYEIVRELYNQGNYDDALSLECEDILEYIALHKKNTVRLKYLDQDYAREKIGLDYESALQIDINYLSESIFFLIECYDRTDKNFDILNFLDEIGEIIDSEIWKEKMIYYKVIIKAFINKDDTEAKDELNKIKDIYEIQDVELLTIYLDLMGNNLTFSQTNEIIGLIIKNTECSALKLKYITCFGLQYLMIGDIEKAITEIENGLNQFDFEKNQQNEVYTDYILGGSYYALGFLKQDSDLLNNARDYYLKSLSFEKYNVNGKAELYNSIGNCYYTLEKYVIAKDYYLQSISFKKSNKTIIDLILVLIDMKADQTEIEKWKLEIDIENLNESEKYDYMLIHAKIALENNDVNSAKEIYIEFEQFEINEPYYKELKDDTVKELMNLCLNQNESKDDKNKSKSKESWLKKIREHLMFQPNIYGIGLKFE